MRPRCALVRATRPLLAGWPGGICLHVSLSSLSRCFPQSNVGSRRFLLRVAGKILARPQLTKRLMRTFITKPNAINTNKVADPP